jgi:sec-independent protein translocase protein TatC
VLQPHPVIRTTRPQMNRKADKAKIPDTTSGELVESTMTLGEHIEELRARLILAIAGFIIGVVVCVIFGRYIISFIVGPYFKIVGNDASSRLIILGPAEGFISYMKIVMIAGLILSSPWVFYQIWMFVAAGLYPREKRYVYITIPFSVILFVAGALFFIFMIAPLTLRILIKSNEIVLGATSEFTFQKYISFVTVMMLVFGLAFQTPIAIFCLNRTGIVSLEAFRRSRKYAILGIVIIAAAIIPGSDPFSLFGLVIPMYLLYELGILMCWLAERRANRKK